MAECLRILILVDNPIDAEVVQFEMQEAGIVLPRKWWWFHGYFCPFESPGM